jgi:PPK2 family polyphosphate:nucleotide phosphotransferase
MHDIILLCRVRFGPCDGFEAFQLSDYDSQMPTNEDLDDSSLVQGIQKMGDKLDKLQTLLYSGKQRGLLLVLQGMDTSGKDGSIRSVFSHVSPLGVRAEAFGPPSAKELEHDFLWRIHARTPALGEIVIFNRSHYEDVLVTRVKGIISKEICDLRYQDIKSFESLLNRQGVKVLKCFLHISKGEQKRRLKERLEDPNKRWKLQPSDFEDRKLWDQFQDAYGDAIRETSTDEAPWYIIPADSKRYRDFCLSTLLVMALKNMSLEPPKARIEFTKLQIESLN